MERDFNFYRKYIARRLQEYETGKIPLRTLVSDIENIRDLLALNDSSLERYENAMVGLEEVHAVLLDDPLAISEEEQKVIIQALIKNIRDIVGSSDEL